MSDRVALMANGRIEQVGLSVDVYEREQVIYIGQSTRYIVRLDRGEQLVAVRQNMETADDELHNEGHRIRLAWAPENTYVLDQQEPPEPKPAAVKASKRGRKNEIG